MIIKYAETSTVPRVLMTDYWKGLPCVKMRLKHILTLDLHITTEMKWSIMLVHLLIGTLYYQSNYNTKILYEKTSLSNPDPV